MSSPEQLPLPKPAKLLPTQVPWKTQKTATALLSLKPAAPGSAGKLVPRALFKSVAAGLKPGRVTFGPPIKPAGGRRVEPTSLVPLPAVPAPGLSAKQVPWAAKKKPTDARPGKASVPVPKASTWARPQSTTPKPEVAPSSSAPLEEARETLRREAEADRGPTAQQLVALLSRKLSRTRETPGTPGTPGETSTPLQAYKARPISFAATPWDVVKLWASAHRLRLGLVGAGLGLMLGMAYLLRLISLDADIDRQWLGVDAAVRQRYATVPAYLACIATYSSEERHTVALAEKALHDWRTAHTEKEATAAAARMERVLTLLAKVMKRYDQNGVAKESEQIASSARFARLEQQRERSRVLLGEKIPAYNQAVDDFNNQVLSVPGSWIAWIADLHARAPFYAGGRAQ